MKLLLISNSTMPGEPYFSYPQPYIKEFLGDEPRHIVFIPFAGVSMTFDEYEQKVKKSVVASGHQLKSIHRYDNFRKAILEAEVIMVGGGNTWHLTRLLHENDLIDAVRKRVIEDGVPYIGWSAGSNVACPTLKTTNDMPIVDPLGFDTFNLVPFQINAHYTDLTVQGHGGETREMRLDEFVIANPDTYVLGLREGSMIWVEDGKYTLRGHEQPCKVFKHGEETKEYNDLSELNF
ncbi:dipeptidase E [Balneicella halophila]|uniref:Dipeptidase E n=1 Tax=Balneicella halophila TaxID=1537566 RepID=A0A7L4USC5_BALHA|nr:dipeptidase PepE [Balneicella halophila]PVX51864.1 dipeptidase E [Balneicella halophila]